MNNRLGAAIVPASSRRGIRVIAVSEFPPRYCGELLGVTVEVRNAT
jgi:hypothetical protein